MSTLPPSPLNPRRIFMVGATGTIGQATLRALLSRGHQVLSFQRPSTQGRSTPEWGHDTLRAHYAQLLSGESRTDLGEHSVF
ncbi:MAG: NAD-dependent epimerase/dehydratase family protein [Alphaproteobacteria bacterium]|nr:NAD-dependent epimerase/dehydratase family protein [Alphaproteobacteria bacterium]